MTDKDKEINWLDDLHEGSRVVSDVEHDLASISSNLRAVGQDGLANKLGRLATHCKYASDLIHDATGTVLSEIIKKS